MENQYIYKVKNHYDCKIQLYQAHSIVNSFVKIMFVQCFLNLVFFTSEKTNICFTLSLVQTYSTEEIIAFLEDKC